MGEMACFSVDPTMQGMGFGEKLLEHIEARARRDGIKELFVLTTRTAHWFLKHGFVPGTVSDLPDNRQKIYNWQRRSQIFVKKLNHK